MSSKRYKTRLKALIRNPFFWKLTIIGNSVIFMGGVILYFLESREGGNQVQFLDSILWSAGTVTTVGYGSFTPETTLGKLMILLLMMLGTLFVWSYMAYVVRALIAPELSTLEKDVHDLEKEVHHLMNETNT